MFGPPFPLSVGYGKAGSECYVCLLGCYILRFFYSCMSDNFRIPTFTALGQGLSLAFLPVSQELFLYFDKVTNFLSYLLSLSIFMIPSLDVWRSFDGGRKVNVHFCCLCLPVEPV